MRFSVHYVANHLHRMQRTTVTYVELTHLKLYFSLNVNFATKHFNIKGTLTFINNLSIICYVILEKLFHLHLSFIIYYVYLFYYWHYFYLHNFVNKFLKKFAKRFVPLTESKRRKLFVSSLWTMILLLTATARTIAPLEGFQCVGNKNFNRMSCPKLTKTTGFPIIVIIDNCDHLFC